MDRDQNTAANTKVSLNSQQGLWESSGGMTANRFAAMISQGRIEDAIAELDHAGYKHGNDPSIDRVFHDKIAVIQKWMERMLDLSVADGAYAWQMIKGMDLPWDSVDSWWADHKAEIMRSLLKMMKDGAYGRVYDIIDEDLRALNLRWPELTVISRSAELEMERQAAQDALDESDDEDEGPIVSISSPDQQIVDHMYRRMREGSWMALQDAISELEQRRMPDHMIEEILSPQAGSIVRWIDNQIQEGSHNNRMIEQAWQLLEMGARWPSLVQLFNKHKDLMVRDMLRQMKTADSLDLEDIEGHLRQLSELGMAWPEMAVISNSVNTELDRIHNIDESGDMLGYRISKGDLIDSMRDSLRAGHNGAWGNTYDHMRPWSIDYARKQLTRIKPDIVAWVNKYLSSEKNTDWRYAKKAVLDIDDLGVDWPELWAVVDRNKAAWIRPWLAELKEVLPRRHWDELADLEDKIVVWQHMFESHGLKWPEITTILASIRGETGKIGHLGEGQLTEGEDLRNYVKSDGRGTLFLNIPVDQTWHTNGHGDYSTVVKPVRVISIKQDIELGSDGWISDLGVEFDSNTWDVDTDGLICTDTEFFRDLQKFLMKLGVPRDIVSQINYGDEGMQDEVYVSFRANAFGEYVADQFVIGDAETMDARKTEIIRAILLYIKDSDFNRAAAIWNKLKELGAAWPELAAIAKSLRAGHTLSEANIEDPVIKQIRRLLGDGQLHGALEVTELLRRHSIQVSKHPELIKLMWEKRDLIKGLVQANILHKSYGAAYEKIADILDTGINWPWLREMADAVPKSDVIRHMLTKMKKDNMFGMDDVAYTIRNARRLGYDWPEFVVIEKSLDAGKNLTESALAKAAVEEAKQMLWRELPGGNWWILGRALDQMIYAKVSHSEIYAVLDEYKEDILAQQNQLTQGENSEVLAGVSNLRRLRDIGAGWPEIDQMLTRNKRHIMRAALTEIKEYSAEEYGDELPHIYNDLKKLKVDWPEMAVIADGILSIQQLGEDWHDVDTDDYDEIYGRVGSALQDIDNGLRTHMDDWHAEMVVNGLADLASLLDDTDWLDTPTPSEYSLDLAKQKPLFVKALLIGMKHSDHDNVQDAIRMLEDYWHVRWPELDIINKSMRAGKLKESEPSYDEEAYRYAEEMAANLPDIASNPSEAMHLFMHLADNPEVVGTDYAEYFQPNKTSWIRFLLTAMKGDEWTEDEIYTAVDILQRMNLGWDELDIIQQSIGANFRG